MNRAGRRQQDKRNRARRSAANSQANEAIAVGLAIPPPPEPPWAHWWDPKKRTWFAHDERVIDFIKALAATPNPDSEAN